MKLSLIILNQKKGTKFGTKLVQKVVQKKHPDQELEQFPVWVFNLASAGDVAINMQYNRKWCNTDH